MAVQVWPQPNLFGFRFPDFVVRRADDSYLVVEIEKPSKALVTAGGQLSADVTHAEQQTTDYRSYLMQHFADMRLHFPAHRPFRGLLSVHSCCGLHTRAATNS
jgi:hypothetical protein